MKQKAKLALVTTDEDLDDQIERIKPINSLGIINQPVNDIAIPLDVRADELYVDHSFQRNRSDESNRRIRNMAENWDWALFERPLLWTDPKGRMSVIDGQHTSIAWLSHPYLPDMIPSNMLTSIHSAKIAAEIFMGRNMNRIRLHHLQEFKAALVAEKLWALQLFQFAKDVGLRIPFTPEQSKVPNTVMSLTAMRGLIESRSLAGAKRVMSILTEGHLKPIRKVHIQAVDHLLFDPEFKGLVNVEKLKAVLRATNDNLILGRMIQNAVETRMTRHLTLAVLYWKEYQERFGIVK